MGYSDSAIGARVKRGEWITVRRGVYRSGIGPITNLQQIMAAVLTLGPRAVASHRAAAFLHQLDGIDDPVVELSVAGPCSSPAGMTIHRVRDLSACDLTQVQRIPATTVTRCLVDLGAVVKEEVVELALEDALRKRVTTIPRLEWRIEELCRQGRRGCRSLKRVLARRDPKAQPTESALEGRLERLLRAYGLPAPVRQFEVRDNGKVVARLDFAFPEQRIAIEADSYRWHSGRIPWERELNRRNELQRRGWFVIHITHRQIRDQPARVIENILDALASRNHPGIPQSLFDFSE